MSEMPLISVVIPVYKTEKYLAKAVESVLSQTYKNIEIILVDDGSPDTCPQICDELAEKHESISVIHKENGGLSSARNAGIEKVTGKYIVFLDSDDTLEMHAIADMVEIVEKENSDAVIPNSYYKVYEDGRADELATHFSEELFIENPQEFALQVQIGKGRAYRSTAVLYRTSVIKENNIRFLSGKISEDYFYNIDFMTVAKKLSLYTKPSLLNLKREGTISASFQKNFAETIWLMDEYATAFIEKIGKNDFESYQKVDSSLCRNIVVYLFSIMSSRNTMSYIEKKELAYYVLNHSKTRNVWKKKNSVPYFDSKVTMVVFNITYMMLRMGAVNLALKLMSVRR